MLVQKFKNILQLWQEIIKKRLDFFEILSYIIYDNKLKLIGYIDAITEKDGKIELLDYKTSKTADIEKYRLQLGIYALLYKMKHGKIPDKASLFFFKHGKKSIKVDESLVQMARDELAKVKEDTKSEEKTDYPKCVTPLCRWATGECDFFDECFDDDNAYKIARADNRDF